jgi:hypothetical protein
LPASFFSGALEAVAGALEAGFLSAALGAISKDLRVGLEEKLRVLLIRLNENSCVSMLL